MAESEINERLFAMSIELFEGDEASAIKWLNSPRPVLGGVTPLEMSKTDAGLREVENLIGRLEHGVFT
ncbi:MAG: MbcA/ParS/Xre antitoxin family protein [Pyrinomonadaceae bacterium]